MNKKLSYNITENITAYNNIDIDLGLSFWPLSYVLSMQNNKFLHDNMLLFNLEDIDSIYNIFSHYKEKYAYQLNNMLFIDSDRNIYPLNYNLENLSYFTIGTYNAIDLNVMDHAMVGVDNFSYQTIFAYNAPNYSYVYSDENMLQTITKTNQGLYTIDDNNIKLKDDKISVNVTKFNYNNNNINTFIDKSNNILNNYHQNIKAKYDTYANILSKDADIYKNYVIQITDRNVSVNKKTNSDEDIIVKDTNYFIIDLPIIYQYNSSIDTDLEYHKILCPIDLYDYDNFKIEIIDNNNKTSLYTRYIAINYDKSYVRDDHSIDMKSVDNKYKLTDICYVSIYFYVNEDIYDYVYNLENIINNNTFKVKITIYNSLVYEFNCWIDVMKNQFKKLYHNYNYGFNFENHGDCVGLLFIPKSSNVLVSANEYNTSIDLINVQNRINNRPQSSLSHKYLAHCSYIVIDKGNNEYAYNLFEKNQGISNTNCNIINKDIFLNFDNNCAYNVFIHDIDFNKNIITNSYTHNNINYFNISLSGENIKNIDIYCAEFNENSNYVEPEQLKHRNFNYIYKNSICPSINNYKLSNNSLYLLNNAFLDTGLGTLKLAKYSDNKVVNNHYVMDYDKHKTVFNKVHEYMKTGFLKGDFYTPCVQDYLLINLFNIKNYFNYNAYKQYKSIFNNENYRFLTNQFNEKNGDIKEYALNVSYIDNFNISLYSNENSSYTYIWPLFRIPDYSIINSNKYVIFYDQKNNCECIDYYINELDKTYIDINCKAYSSNDADININNFYIFDDDFNEINSIKVSELSIFDTNNNIYKLKIYIDKPVKITKFYICFIDSESYLNHTTIKVNIKNELKDVNYRILCRVYLKNDAI